MIRLFNGNCSLCKDFKPRCARVVIRAVLIGGESYRTEIICEDCRRERKGQYRVAKEHRQS